MAHAKKRKTAATKTTHHKKSGEKKESLSQRGLWNGNISFGLVNIAVRVVSAKEQPDLHFSMLDPSNLSPVGYKYYNKATGEEVSRNKTVKAYEYKPDQYVILTDADFKKANPKATQTIDIENFVELDDIDPVFFDRAYYLLPNKGSEKAYRLLTEALLQTRKVGVAKMVLHTKQHLVALIPRGHYLLLELLHFAEDVKELRDLGDWQQDVPAIKTASKEVEMAERLIDDMSSRWDPEDYHDTYREDIMKMVQAKVKAGKATEITPESEVVEEEKGSNVVDLMPLLRQSLQAKSKRSKRSSHHEKRPS
jgi:DNA end-binding protein Ku